MVTRGHSIPKESKALISFLNKLGTETKLQSFNLKGILKDPGILRKGVLTSHPRDTVVLLDTGTPGTSREIFSEDADDGTRTRNPSITNRVL